jgi:hypothetical protein
MILQAMRHAGVKQIGLFPQSRRKLRLDLPNCGFTKM